MGANQQTSVPAFVSGQVLTAQQQTEINTGIPVFADSTARTAAFGGTGEKVLAEGQYSYLEDTNSTEVYDGSSWVSVSTAPGLVLISSTTIGSAVSSVTVSGAFSATYDAYKIIIVGGVGSTTITLRLQLGATTAGYYNGGIGLTYGGVNNVGNTNNGSNWFAGSASTKTINVNLDVLNPFASKETTYNGQSSIPTTTGSDLNFAGFLDDTTSYTAFTVLTSTGTITGGTIRVYGYKN